MRLLLISNSTNSGGAYLEHPMAQIRDFLGDNRLRCVFIPYAGVTIGHDEYTAKVRSRFAECGHDVISVHETRDPLKTLENAQAIIVGGGNTFRLLSRMQEEGMLRVIRERIHAGFPYIGWSAGANMACPTIRTTNDMPVVEPSDFRALGLIPFQINPHYTDLHPEGHAGETREMRISEFLELNPDIWVAGLREGTMFMIEGSRVELIGPRPARLFRKGTETFERRSGEDFSFLWGNESGS